MCFAYWIPKAIHTYSEYVTVVAFPQQQWLYECTSMLHYMYTPHFVKICGDKKTPAIRQNDQAVQPSIHKLQRKLLGNFVSTVSPMICCIPFQLSVVYV